MKLTEQQKKLVEKLGVMHEQSGMSPIEARIMSLLLISDETELTFDDIRELLEISKSATSNALNILQKINKIEYITKIGDRKRYFRSRIRNWEKDSETQLMGMLEINSILKEVLSIRTEKTAEFNQSLKEITEFIDYLQLELTGIFEKWKQKK